MKEYDTLAQEPGPPGDADVSAATCHTQSDLMDHHSLHDRSCNSRRGGVHACLIRDGTRPPKSADMDTIRPVPATSAISHSRLNAPLYPFHAGVVGRFRAECATAMTRSEKHSCINHALLRNHPTYGQSDIAACSPLRPMAGWAGLLRYFSILL
ncbi:hypothetical protein EJ03DRAFT_324284 [Teratosphaeria nubilosa]|uniref:Uncharacterized protein n=1 Tax=Teratosphaeria nubilosa TaxID=161662 RepID=A0A6G1LJX4_9PEZI|nr:hypothetical protein EJ03DRAFT_324284 [Teratosphaeria nubilosa]